MYTVHIKFIRPLHHLLHLPLLIPFSFILLVLSFFWLHRNAFIFFCQTFPFFFIFPFLILFLHQNLLPQFNHNLYLFIKVY
mmetsp:Transcript_16922/g.2350  ORF Transcript_16922/g.2350 Transcript_16922/m.2350 type:complete len:81 (-) Transcript_16922:29-271(-)